MSNTGFVLPSATIYDYYPTPTAKIDVTTLLIEELLTRIITVTNSIAVTLTLPTGILTHGGMIGGANASGGLTNTLAINQGFEWSIINLGSDAGNVILTEAAIGHTIVGNPIVVIGTSAKFCTRIALKDTAITYRLT